ncbi:MAG TPA: methionyl-tRNA formyltransferase [Actinomycetota bacterium]
MRVAFLGNDPWSVPPLEALAGSSHEPALVVTRVPRPAGRGGKLRPTAVADAARARGLSLAEVETVKRGEGLETLRAARPEVLVVVAYGEILPAEVLSLAYPVNVHFSLLPALRGADPVRRAILEGHVVSGVTIMRMDEGMDTGPMLLQVSEPIRDEDDGGTLGMRLAERGAALLVEAVDRLQAGDLPERPQGEGATLAPKLTAEDEWIDWTEDAAEVWRRVRAFAPDPGARTRFRGKLLKVLRAAPAEGSGAPGEVVEVTNDGITIAAGEGALALAEVLPEGRKRISGADLVRGYRPAPGERLGS